MDMIAFIGGGNMASAIIGGLRKNGRDAASIVVVDPGEEPERLLAAIEAMGAEVDAILLTHTHFDHVGAVAPLARATGAPGGAGRAVVSSPVVIGPSSSRSCGCGRSPSPPRRGSWCPYRT